MLNFLKKLFIIFVLWVFCLYSLDYFNVLDYFSILAESNGFDKYSSSFVYDFYLNTFRLLFNITPENVNDLHSLITFNNDLSFLSEHISVFSHVLLKKCSFWPGFSMFQNKYSVVLCALLFVEFYFVFFITSVLILGLFKKNNIQSIYNWKKLLGVIIVGLIIEIILLLCLLGIIYPILDMQPDYFVYWYNNFYYSKTMIWIKIFICVLAICYFISIWDYFNYERYLNLELPVLILLCIEGMFLLLISNNLFLIYLAIELQSLSLYILASIKRYSNLSIEAGLKYFIFGSFASGLLLFGISLIYGFAGTTNLNELYYMLYLSNLNDISVGILFGYTLILIGLLFKLGLVPFHYWLVDVYDGSPLLITYFFSILPKISILILFYRIFFFVFTLILLYSIILMFFYFFVFVVVYYLC